MRTAVVGAAITLVVYALFMAWITGAGKGTPATTPELAPTMRTAVALAALAVPGLLAAAAFVN